MPKSAAILDLGCSDGALLAHLQSNGFTNARGVDCSAEQARALLARGGAAEQGDLIPALAANPAAFDAILAIDVIEHMTKPERAHLSHLLRMALKPGGLLVVRTPNGDGVGAGWIVHGDLTRETTFTELSLGQYLRAFGFTELRFRETGPLHHSLKSRISWIGWQVLRAAAQLGSLIQTGHLPLLLTTVITATYRTPQGEQHP